MKHFKSLAIIGCNGMVGSDLMRYLKPYFKNITGIDSRNYDQYRGQSFDVVINANGNSSKVWASKHILGDFEASTTSVYKSLFDFSCKTYIYLSSADVYLDHTNTKTTRESQIINTDDLSPYGLHKYLSENIIKNNTKNYLIFRCSMILGTILKKGPIYDILHSKRLFVNSESAFQMITTEEIAHIIYFLLTINKNNETFNIGGRETVLFKNLSNYIKKPIVFPKNGEKHIYETNVSKLNKIFSLKTSSEYLQDLIKNIK